MAKAKANKAQGSSKASTSTKANTSTKAKGNSTVPTLPQRGAKYTGSKLPAGVVAPAGYVPTARAVAAAVARIAAGATQVTAMQYGRARTTGVAFCGNCKWVLTVLAKAGQPIGSAVGVQMGAKLGATPGGKVTPRNWRHYCYHMAATGHVVVAGGAGGYTYAITPKGKAALAKGAF